MHTWDVSASAGQTLTSIDFVDDGPGVNTIILRAVMVDQTVFAAVPEPSTVALATTALLARGGVSARRRRR